MSEKNVKNVPARKTPQKTPATKEAKPGFLGKVVNFFKRLPANIAKPFRNTWRELKNVTWPTRENLINSTLLVIAFMVFMGVVIGLLDMGSTEVVKMLSRWAA